MARFQYQARQRSGDEAVGEIEAASLLEARHLLRTQGLYVLALSPAQPASGLAARSKTSWFSRTSKSDLVMLVSQLTIMCQSGVDLAEALQHVATQCTKPALREVLEQVHADVSSGCSFSESLRRHPRVFDESFVATIAAGEESGAITAVLERLSYLLRGDVRLMNTVWSMLMYPIVLCSVTFLVVNALLFFVLPQFAQVFTTLGKPVPPLTGALLALGSFMQEHAVPLIVGLILCTLAGYTWRNAEIVRRFWDHVTLNMVLVRDATRALLTGRSFRLLGTMLMSGVPLVDGIRLCQRAVKNRLFRELFSEVERDVLHGAGMARPLLAARFLPPGAAQMVVTAERSGRMGEVLKNIGEYYEDQGEQSLRSVVKVAEPAVVVVLGVVVAGVVLSIIIPMLDVSTMS